LQGDIIINRDRQGSLLRTLWLFHTKGVYTLFGRGLGWEKRIRWNSVVHLYSYL